MTDCPHKRRYSAIYRGTHYLDGEHARACHIYRQECQDCGETFDWCKCGENNATVVPPRSVRAKQQGGT